MNLIDRSQQKKIEPFSYLTVNDFIIIISIIYIDIPTAQLKICLAYCRHGYILHLFESYEA